MTLRARDYSKIAVFRALQLGDMLCAIPAIRALRNAYPHAEITLIGLPWAAELVKRFSNYFDRLIVFPGYPGLPEQPYDEGAFKAFREKMLAEEFDLLIQMQGNGTIVNDMLSQMGAAQIAGYYNAQCFVNSPLFIPYPNYASEIERHLRLMNHLGIASQGTQLEFPITIKDEEALEKTGLQPRVRKYVCVHPGSRGAYRQWPPQYFGLLANQCLERKLQVVLTGTPDEKPIVHEVMKWIKGPVIDACGKTNLGAVSVLIRDAALLIANCTGVSHIASALGTPSVIISMDGEPERWGPLNRHLHKVVDWTTAPHIDVAAEALASILPQKAVKL